MKYTSEEFERIDAMFEYAHEWEGPLGDGDIEIVRAALRIASLVTKPGVIEGAITAYTGPDPTGIVAAAIRKAVGASDE